MSPAASDLAPASCPTCHTADAATTNESVAKGGAWRCARCGQHWTAERLAAVSSYAAWAAAHDARRN